MSKTLLEIDEQGLKNAKLMAETTVMKLNQLISNAESDFKKQFTNEEKLDIKADPVSFIDKYVETLFLFPTATKRFNLEAIGIDLDKLLNEAKLVQGRLKNYDLELLNGEFRLLENQEFEEQFYHYANEAQGKALKKAEKLSRALNEAIAGGYLSDRILFSIRDDHSNNIIDTESNGPNSFKATPNTRRIRKFIQ